jgi:repressor LexA
MTGLTAKQAECMEFLRSYSRVNGFSPTYSEIRDHLGLASKSGVLRLVIALEQRGHIRRLKHSSRAVRLVEPGMVCPHCGFISGSAECVADAQKKRNRSSSRRVLAGEVPGGLASPTARPAGGISSIPTRGI